MSLIKNKVDTNFYPVSISEVDWHCDYLWSTHRGCPFDCVYCLDGETLILMSDYSTKAIRDVDVGDKIVGVKPADNGYFSTCESIVINTMATFKESVKIILDNGEYVICSADHRWLTDRGWKYTLNNEASPDRAHLTTNNIIFNVGLQTDMSIHLQTELYQRGYLSGMIRGDAHLGVHEWMGKGRTTTSYQFRLALIDLEGIIRTKRFLENFGIKTEILPFKKSSPSNQDIYQIRTYSRAAFNKIHELIIYQDNAEYKRGFMAGLFDAEGYSSAGCPIRISNSNDEILQFMEKCLGYYGFDYCYDVERQPKNKVVKTIRIKGGQREELRFRQISDYAILRHRNKVATIKNSDKGFKVKEIVRLDGARRMFDLTTTTENFIANGMVSHNCSSKKLNNRFKSLGDPTVPRRLKGEWIKDWEIEIIKRTILPNASIFLSPYNDIMTVPQEDIRKIMTLCLNNWGYGLEYRSEDCIKKIKTTYMKKSYKQNFILQTKDPAKYFEYIDLIPEGSWLGTTIETNLYMQYANWNVSKSPNIRRRKIQFKEVAKRNFKYRYFITIEPILKFSNDFIYWIDDIQPDLIFIGANTSKVTLPEPTNDELVAFIYALYDAVGVEKVYLKSNIRRLIPAFYDGWKLTEKQNQEAELRQPT